MKLMQFLYRIFGSKPKDEDPNRRLIKDVKVGESIYIEWDQCKGGIAHIVCINNDPLTKKILLQMTWNNYREIGCSEKEKLILSYDSIQLANFHLLNEIKNAPQTAPKEEDITTLQKEKEEAIAKEEYEKADELQKKINKLSRKK